MEGCSSGGSSGLTDEQVRGTRGGATMTTTATAAPTDSFASNAQLQRGKEK